MRLVPTTSFLLSPACHVEETSTVSIVTQDDRDRLKMKFGSKRQQRVLENHMRLRTDADYLKDKLKGVVDRMSVEQVDQQPAVDSPDPAYLPPINRNAATVDDVYKLHDIVSAEELAFLKEEAIRAMKEPKKEM